MPILEKIKSYFALFYNPQKNQNDEPEDYMEKFERLYRNGLSDEEWEAKKREHPGLFSELVLIMLVRLGRRVGFLRF